MDLLQLSLADTVRVLNSSSLGTVVTKIQADKLLDEAGLKIRNADGKTINFPRFVAFLHERAQTLSAPPDPGGYEAHRARTAAEQKRLSEKAREIGPIPQIKDVARRNRAGQSTELFAATYLQEVFYLPLADYHPRLFALTDDAIRHGGLHAAAVPRGGGKSAIHAAGMLRALLYGLIRFGMIVGAESGETEKTLALVAGQLASNDLLAEDFPEVCFPIRELHGIPGRANGQVQDGTRTQIQWRSSEIVLPYVKGILAWLHAQGVVQERDANSGRLVCHGLLAAGLRGAKFLRPDGILARPDLVLLDDIETSESASSPSQVAKRDAVIDGTILGMAGPGKRIACLMSCNIWARDCVADRRTNRQLYAGWHGERYGILKSMPKNMDLWNEYRRLMEEAMRRDERPTEATAFYVQNRTSMDEGAEATWKHRLTVDTVPPEVSAIQHAMNSLFRIGRSRFMAELMNDPEAEASSTPTTLEPDMIANKANGMLRGLVPMWATRLVAFCDVNKEILYYGVVAVDDAFRGHVVDYGPWPDQPSDYWIKRDVKATLEGVEGVIGLEASLRAGLDSLAARLLSKPWPRQDQGVQTIERMLVDARWPDSQEVVHAFCRESVHSAVLTPSYGQYVGAKHLPMRERNKAVGDRVGLNWKMPKPKPGRQRYVTFDTNFWKQFLERRWLQPLESPGCWTIFGSPEDHRLFADHNTAEYIVQTTARGRTVDEYQAKPARDNEGFDAMVGCCVAASIGGSALAEMPRFAHKPKETIKLSDRVVAGRAAYESASVPQTDAAMTVAENPALRQGLNRQAAAEFDEPISAQPAAAPSKSGPARIKLSDLIRKGRLQ